MRDEQISIIIPTYNEAKNIGPLLESIKRNTQNLSKVETIVVDDNSPDGTSEIVNKYIKSIKKVANNSISLLTRSNQKGLSSAIMEGMKKAKGEFILVMDSDFSHPPELIPKMIETLQQKKIDIVVASRYISSGATMGWSFKRRAISKIATKVAQYGLGVKTKDPMSGFFALRSTLLKNLKFDAIGYKMLLEILVKTRNATVKEIPYTFTDRRHGTSKLDLNTAINYCIAVWKLYRYGKSMENNEKRTSVRFLSKTGRFFTVGATGLGINYAISLLFSLYLDFWYLHATFMGIIFSITSNFVFNKYWTFRDLDFSFKKTITQYGAFVCFSSIGAIVQLGMIFYLVDKFEISYPISLILAVATAAFSNFILNKKWTFKEKIWS